MAWTRGQGRAQLGYSEAHRPDSGLRPGALSAGCRPLNMSLSGRGLLLVPICRTILAPSVLPLAKFLLSIKHGCRNCMYVGGDRSTGDGGMMTATRSSVSVGHCMQLEASPLPTTGEKKNCRSCGVNVVRVSNFCCRRCRQSDWKARKMRIRPT